MLLARENSTNKYPKATETLPFDSTVWHRSDRRDCIEGNSSNDDKWEYVPETRRRYFTRRQYTYWQCNAYQIYFEKSKEKTLLLYQEIIYFPYSFN